MQTQPIGFLYTWIDTSLALEMLVGFAATTFIAICLLRHLHRVHQAEAQA